MTCPGGGIGRHKGFKIPRRQLRAGSSPALGTSIMSDNEVDLVEQVSNLWKFKSLIIFLAIFFGVVFTLSSYLFQPKFESKSILSIVQDESNSSNLPSINFPSFGGLAQSAGISLNNGSGNMDVVVIETIKSKTFFKHLLSVADIQKELIGDKNISNSYIAIHDEIFSKQLKVFINKETGLIHLSYTHISANFSKDIVTLIINEINNVFRKNKLIELKKSRDYFEAEYEIATENSVRSSLTFLLEKNLNETMLANVRDEYILEIIEEPFVPVKKSSPKRSIFLIIGLMFGLISGSLIAIIRFNFLQSRDI